MAHKRSSSKTWWLMTLILVLGVLSSQVQGSKKSRDKGSKSSKSSKSSRIIYGEDAAKHEFPSMVSLCNKTQEGKPCKNICGAILISPDWVMTAAHCLTSEPALVEAIAGLHKQTEQNDADAQLRSTVEFKKHPDFTKELLNDIALVKVSPPFELNEFVKPTILPDAAHRASGLVTAAGWGLTDKSKYADVLQKLQIPIIPDKECEQLVPKYHAENKLCTGDPKGYKNTCIGDSGGPLYEIDGEKQTAVGITSAGPIPCGAVLIPALYTEVAYFVDWIKKEIGQ